METTVNVLKTEYSIGKLLRAKVLDDSCIHTVAKEAVSMAIDNGCVILFDFKGIDVIATQGCTPDKVVQLYHTELEAKQIIEERIKKSEIRAKEVLEKRIAYVELYKKGIRKRKPKEYQNEVS